MHRRRPVFIALEGVVIPFIYGGWYTAAASTTAQLQLTRPSTIYYPFGIECSLPRLHDDRRGCRIELLQLPPPPTLPPPSDQWNC